MWGVWVTSAQIARKPSEAGRLNRVVLSTYQTQDSTTETLLVIVPQLIRLALKHGSIDGLGRGPHMSIRCQESG